MNEEINKIKRFVGKGKLLKAIEMAIDSVLFKEILNELYVVRGRYANNEIEKNKGVIDQKSYVLTRNNVSESFMSLIDYVESTLDLKAGEPRFLDSNGGKHFETYWSVYVGKKINQENLKRVENISWSSKSEFILTHCLNSDTIYIWDFAKRKLKESLKGIGPLKKVSFHKHDNSIWAVEDERRIVVWKKENSKDNDYGFVWTRNYVIEVPSDYLINSIILDAIFNVHIDKFFSFILIKENKDSDKAELMYFKHEYSYEEENTYFFKPYKIFYGPKIKYLYFLNGQLAVCHGYNKISIVRPEDSEKKLDGKDIDFYVSMDSDVFVTSTDYGGLNSITLWKNTNSDKIEPYKYKYHWNAYHAYSKVISSERFSLIKIYRGYPYPCLEVIASHEYNGDLYHLIYGTDKNFEIDRVRSIKLHGHKDAITRIDLTGPGITTSSKDGTIRVWFLNSARNSKVLGCITNCHSLAHPFEWDPENRRYIAYADVEGYLHILNLNYNPYEEDRHREKRIVAMYKFLRRALNFSLIIYVCLFVFFYGSNSEENFFSKIKFAFNEPTIQFGDLLNLPINQEFASIGTFIAFFCLYFVKKQTYTEIRNKYPRRLKRFNRFDGEI